ncbi:MAG: hypothetical protein RLZZ455_504 [Candidatus Parcubacteria bacterium]
MGCGGTFDLFHAGHISFLLDGLAHSEKLLIGITSDKYASEKKEHLTESYEERKAAVEAFILKQNASHRVEILPLESVYIPKGWEHEPIESILITPDSLPGALEINRKREEGGEKPLSIVTTALSLAEDGGPISSSRIRLGEIERSGRCWIANEWYGKEFILPPHLRERLSRPFGEIVDAKTYPFTENEKKCLLAVGDVTTLILHGRNIVPKLSVIDLVVERVRRYKDVSEMGLHLTNLTYIAQNTPGQISSTILHKIRDAFVQIRKGQTVLLQVTGEEDLLVLPILLQAPLGWVLCYGQPKKGTVIVRVDEKIKSECRELLQQFTMR